jgi:hypothetical protein
MKDFESVMTLADRQRERLTSEIIALSAGNIEGV